MYRFRLDWIASFVAVAQYGGFSAAAGVLYRSQPRVSIHVAELERALGVRLFDRSVHPAVLTPEGRAALPHAQAMLSHLRELADSASITDGNVHGEMRLAIYPSASVFLVPELLVRLAAAHPHIRVVLREGATKTLGQMLLGGEADLAIRPVLPRAGSDRLAYGVLWREPLVAVVAADHPMAEEPFVQLSELADMHLITIGEDDDQSSTQFETTLAFDHAGLTPQVVHRTNQPQTLVALVRRRLGTGVTNSLAMTTSNLDGVRLVPIADAHCSRDVALWWRTDQQRSQVIAAVKELITSLPVPRTTLTIPG
jgi:DNA-binding transcriptional LysR family regulator